MARWYQMDCWHVRYIAGGVRYDGGRSCPASRDANPVKQWELDNTTTQIIALRERMGDLNSPPNKINRGRYRDGSLIRPEVHAKRVKRLIKLEKHAETLIFNGLNGWFNKAYRA